MRRAGYGVVVTFGGASTALLGLAWDLSIHLNTPGGAAHESPVDIFNPAHDLIALGVVVAALGATWTLLRDVDARLGSAGLVAVVLSIGWITVSAFAGPAVPGATAQQRDAANRLWRATEVATSRYRSLAAAESEGYIAYNPIGDPLIHYVNPAYMHDGRILDPAHVESLLYETTLRGAVLVAAMYSLEDPTAGPPDVAGALTPWHRHDDLCFTAAGEVAGSAPSCPPGSTTYFAPWMLHVWLVPDRFGQFAADIDPWNELSIELTR